MTRKLTLTVEDNIIGLAKRYAAAHGLSLSEMIENYLKVVVGPSARSGENALSPKVKKLLGSVKKTGSRSYKDTLAGELRKKYKK